MSRQYNMYNVQLSEFWKQRCDKEALHNAPFLIDGEEEQSELASETPSRAITELSTAVVSLQKVVLAAFCF